MERYGEQGMSPLPLSVEQLGLSDIEDILKSDSLLIENEAERLAREVYDNRMDAWISQHGGREVQKPVWE